jgi:homocysteine S-methyltransferase
VKNPFDPFLARKGFVLLDGGLATELERRGADLADPLWSAKLLIEAPERIEELHHDYFLAGADVGTSASYQATFEGFAARGLSAREAEGLLRLSVELVHRARDRFWSASSNRVGRSKPLVAASIGCYGASLHDGSEYTGDYGLSRSELADFHRRRLLVLADSGADLLAFETIPSKLEAEAIAGLLRELKGSTALPPVWIGFSCRNENEVSHGETLAECLEIMGTAEAVVAMGINCTPPAFISGLLSSVRGATERLLVVYPNSGERWEPSAHEWRPGVGSRPIDELGPEWRSLGARLIGGCCRTTPETIRALAAALA